MKKEQDRFGSGWVQINNTIVPYIMVDGCKTIPVAIVTLAAGLLGGCDLDRMVWPADDYQLEELDRICRDAGIKFSFKPKEPLMKLVDLCKAEKKHLLVSELPESEPLEHAIYIILRYSQEKNLSSDKRLPQETCSREPEPRYNLTVSHDSPITDPSGLQIKKEKDQLTQKSCPLPLDGHTTQQPQDRSTASSNGAFDTLVRRSPSVEGNLSKCPENYYAGTGTPLTCTTDRDWESLSTVEKRPPTDPRSNIVENEHATLSGVGNKCLNSPNMPNRNNFHSLNVPHGFMTPFHDPYRLTHWPAQGVFLPPRFPFPPPPPTVLPIPPYIPPSILQWQMSHPPYFRHHYKATPFYDSYNTVYNDHHANKQHYNLSNVGCLQNQPATNSNVLHSNSLIQSNLQPEPAERHRKSDKENDQSSTVLKRHWDSPNERLDKTLPERCAGISALTKNQPAMNSNVIRSNCMNHSNLKPTPAELDRKVGVENGQSSEVLKPKPHRVLKTRWDSPNEKLDKTLSEKRASMSALTQNQQATDSNILQSNSNANSNVKHAPAKRGRKSDEENGQSTEFFEQKLRRVLKRCWDCPSKKLDTPLSEKPAGLCVLTLNQPTTHSNVLHSNSLNQSIVKPEPTACECEIDEENAQPSEVFKRKLRRVLKTHWDSYSAKPDKPFSEMRSGMCVLTQEDTPCHEHDRDQAVQGHLQECSRSDVPVPENLFQPHEYKDSMTNSEHRTSDSHAHVARAQSTEIQTHRTMAHWTKIRLSETHRTEAKRREAQNSSRYFRGHRLSKQYQKLEERLKNSLGSSVSS